MLGSTFENFANPFQESLLYDMADLRPCNRQRSEESQVFRQTDNGRDMNKNANRSIIQGFCIINLKVVHSLLLSALIQVRVLHATIAFNWIMQETIERS